MDRWITELKSSMDKTMNDLKMTTMATKFKDFEIHLDIVKVKMEETEL